MAFKCQISAVARPLFNSNALCGTVFSLLDSVDVHFIRLHCPSHLLMVKHTRLLLNNQQGLSTQTTNVNWATM